MVELLQMKVVATSNHHHHHYNHRSAGASGGLLSNNGSGNRGFTFGGSDDEEDDDDEHDHPESAVPLTPEEAKMVQVLTDKRQEVIFALIGRLSAKNNDFENCLNANSILIELADNDQLFGKLVESQNFNKLISNACDIKNRNQAYAINVLNTIIKEYPNYES